MKTDYSFGHSCCRWFPLMCVCVCEQSNYLSLILFLVFVFNCWFISPSVQMIYRCKQTNGKADLYIVSIWNFQTVFEIYYLNGSTLWSIYSSLSTVWFYYTNCIASSTLQSNMRVCVCNYALEKQNNIKSIHFREKRDPFRNPVRITSNTFHWNMRRSNIVWKSWTITIDSMDIFIWIFSKNRTNKSIWNMLC